MANRSETFFGDGRCKIVCRWLAILSPSIVLLVLVTVFCPMVQTAFGQGDAHYAEPDQADINAFEQEMDALPADGVSDLSLIDEGSLDYDILLNIPVQMENIRDNVDKFKVLCKLGKSAGSWNHFTYYMYFGNTIDLVDGAYNGTVKLPINIPPETTIHGDSPQYMYPTDIDFYICDLRLHDTVSDGWSLATTDEDVPLWRQSSTDELRIWSPIFW